MKRSRYTRILLEGDVNLSERLVRDVIEANREIHIVRKPEIGLVMQKVKDAVKGSPFYAGELLTTSCTVRVSGETGFGICLGEQPDKAYRLAVIDAAFKAALPETEKWMSLLLDEERNIRSRHLAEHRQVMQTQVRFETPDEYFNRMR